MTIVEASEATTKDHAGTLQERWFLGRLSGRRRHVRRSRPGAAASKSPDCTQDHGDMLEEEGCCPRCRCIARCSCTLLGFEDEERLGQVSAGTQEDDDGRSGRTEQRCHQVGCSDRDVTLRRRPPERRDQSSYHYLGGVSRTAAACTLATLFIISFLGAADACSSRSTPKPRPPTPTPRPNITFHMYSCPSNYAEWYCLNGATCFTVKIVDSLLYNCLCSNGFIGQRCEFKDLDGSYLPSRQRIMLETASIAGAVTIAVFLAVIAFISIYIHCKRKQKELRMSNGVDAVDGPGRDPELRPFCSRSRSLMIFMAKNPNSSVTAPSIEHTRMPTPAWSYPPESSTRTASINENKRPSQ